MSFPKTPDPCWKIIQAIEFIWLCLDRASDSSQTKQQREPHYKMEDKQKVNGTSAPTIIDLSRDGDYTRMMETYHDPLEELERLAKVELRRNLNQSIELHRKILTLCLSSVENQRNKAILDRTRLWAFHAVSNLLKQYVALQCFQPEFDRVHHSLLSGRPDEFNIFVLSRINLVSSEFAMLGFSDHIVDKLNCLLCHTSAGIRKEANNIAERAAPAAMKPQSNMSSAQQHEMLAGLNLNLALRNVASATMVFMQEMLSTCAKQVMDPFLAPKEFVLCETRLFNLLQNTLEDFDPGPLVGVCLDYCVGKCGLQNCQNTRQSQYQANKDAAESAMKLMSSMRRVICREMWPKDNKNYVDPNTDEMKCGCCGSPMVRDDTLSETSSTTSTEIPEPVKSSVEIDSQSQPEVATHPDHTQQAQTACEASIENEDSCSKIPKEQPPQCISQSADTKLNQSCEDKTADVDGLANSLNERLSSQAAEKQSFRGVLSTVQDRIKNGVFRKCRSHTCSSSHKSNSKSLGEIKEKYERRNLGNFSACATSDESRTKTKVELRSWPVVNSCHFYDVWRQIFPETGDPARTRGFKFHQFIAAISSPPFNCRVKDDMLGVKVNFARRNEDGGEETFNVHAPHGRNGWVPANYMWYYRKNLRRGLGIDGSNIFLVADK